jgi:subtilisin family serine protease
MTTTDNQPTTTKSNAPVSGVHTVQATPDFPDSLGEGRKQGHGDIGRVPVAVLAAAPPWRPLAADRSVRRPVIALPDSGVEQHPWLDGTPGDPVVLDAGNRYWQPPSNLVTSDSRPYRGHATFVAGVIRQLAPDCQLLSARVMGDNGAVQGDASLGVLTHLADRVTSGDPDQFVDVVCLAYGFQPGSPPSFDDQSHIDALRAQFERLVGANVLVVMSAGNYGDSSKTYPAAFAAESALASNVVSVGATNPDGSYAYYASWGPWVTYQAIGSGVISTMPRFNGSMSAEPLEVTNEAPYPDPKGVLIDPDNFEDGFARWSGTSFSAATVAGLLGRALAADPAPPGPERTARALAAIRGQQTHWNKDPA